MNNQWLMINQLDAQLREWQAIHLKYGKPRDGWVKTLRVALSMTIKQLAERLGVSRARVIQLEKSEVHDAITLRSLREAADALECELIYAIVPKGHSNLESILKKRAEYIANERVNNVAHSMALEAQSVSPKVLKKQKTEVAQRLLANLNKKFWATKTIKQKKLS